MKLIDTKAHGAIDYALGIFLLCVPYMLSLGEPSPKINIFYLVGTALILYSTLTKYDLGLLSLIPLPLHNIFDVISGLVLAASPWLFSFSDEVYIPHIVFGFALLMLPIITNSKKNDTTLIN